VVECTIDSREVPGERKPVIRDDDDDDDDDDNNNNNNNACRFHLLISA
jgi:hypothetical protein